jgi:hypothetical protein
MYGLGDLMGICDYVLLGCAAHGRVRFFIRSLALHNTSRPTSIWFWMCQKSFKVTCMATPQSVDPHCPEWFLVRV